MKDRSTFFLKIVLILMALFTLAGLLWFPQTEGRAVNLDLISIYTDPFILYLYFASTPFFLTLFQAYKLLGHVDHNTVFSQAAITLIRNIKYCAFVISGFLVGAILFIRLFANGDDAAGPTMLGMIIIFISLVIATAIGIFQKLVQHAVDLKSENDLTV